MRNGHSGKRTVSIFLSFLLSLYQIAPVTGYADTPSSAQQFITNEQSQSVPVISLEEAVSQAEQTAEQTPPVDPSMEEVSPLSEPTSEPAPKEEVKPLGIPAEVIEDPETGAVITKTVIDDKTIVVIPIPNPEPEPKPQPLPEPDPKPLPAPEPAPATYPTEQEKAALAKLTSGMMEFLRAEVLADGRRFYDFAVSTEAAGGRITFTVMQDMCGGNPMCMAPALLKQFSVTLGSPPDGVRMIYYSEYVEINVSEAGQEIPVMAGQKIRLIFAGKDWTLVDLEEQPPAIVDPGKEAAAKAAESLAGMLNLSEEDKKNIQVVSVKKQTWTSGCVWNLPGQMCTMAIVNDYAVVLKLYQNEYEFRAGTLDPAKSSGIVAMNDLVKKGLAKMPAIKIVSSDLEPPVATGITYGTEWIFKVVLNTGDANKDYVYYIDYRTKTILSIQALTRDQKFPTDQENVVINKLTGEVAYFDRYELKRNGVRIYYFGTSADAPGSSLKVEVMDDPCGNQTGPEACMAPAELRTFTIVLTAPSHTRRRPRPVVINTATATGEIKIDAGTSFALVFLNDSYVLSGMTEQKAPLPPPVVAGINTQVQDVTPIQVAENPAATTVNAPLPEPSSLPVSETLIQPTVGNFSGALVVGSSASEASAESVIPAPATQPGADKIFDQFLKQYPELQAKIGELKERLANGAKKSKLVQELQSMLKQIRRERRYQRK